MRDRGDVRLAGQFEGQPAKLGRRLANLRMFELVRPPGLRNRVWLRRWVIVVRLVEVEDVGVADFARLANRRSASDGLVARHSEIQPAALPPEYRGTPSTDPAR